MDDLPRLCCLNADCKLYGRRDAGNLSVRDRYGKRRHIRLLFCNACKARFSERKGTPLSHSCLPAGVAASVLEHLAEGNGVRQTDSPRDPGDPARRDVVARDDDPADEHKGDWWGHVAYDAEHRPVLAVVPGSRSMEDAEEVVREARDRTGGRADVLLTSDEYPAYEAAITHVYGVSEEPEPGPKPGDRR